VEKTLLFFKKFFTVHPRPDIDLTMIIFLYEFLIKKLFYFTFLNFRKKQFFE